MKKAILYAIIFVLGIAAGVSQATSGVVPERSLNIPKTAGTLPVLRIDVLHTDGQVYSMDLEEYVKGVVASEMPSSFSLEALKAQAVLARTYAVRRMRILAGTPSVSGADLTSDPKKDQAWNPESVIKERMGPLNVWLYWPKIERAVEETKGQILTYQGAPCEVVYHSTCGGKTEAAKDVWGKDVPYLQSVVCGYCERSPYFQPQRVVLSKERVSELLAAAGLAVPAAKVGTESGFRITSLSPTGRIKTVSAGGATLSGLEFRAALNLKSQIISWTIKGDNVVFTVRGYGHGVGMCQYGADGMARQGKNYIEILTYYYPGTQVRPMFEE